MKGSNRPFFTEDAGKRDAAFIRAVLGGDTEAFGKLVEIYHPVAVGTAYRLLNNTDDALEVVQEACIRAYRSLGRLKEPARFGPWFMRIVSNLSLNARRSRKSSSTIALDDQMEKNSGAEPASPDVGPERHVEGRELQAAIDAALEKLPEKQRIALLLFTVEGWAQKDIAEMLECSLEMVKWNVFQARKRLREILGDRLSGHD